MKQFAKTMNPPSVLVIPGIGPLLLTRKVQFDRMSQSSGQLTSFSYSLHWQQSTGKNLEPNGRQ